jgi:hypothetical protein
MRLDEPIPFVATTTHTAEQAYEQVLKYVGASLHRDTLDRIMVSDARNGRATFTGSGNRSGLINSQDDVKAIIPTLWPELKQGDVLPDTDGDGMPDEWEDSHGLNKSNKADGNAKGADGYTNLEVYLNSLVAHITEAQNEGGVLMGQKLESETTGISHSSLFPFPFSLAERSDASGFSDGQLYDLQGRHVLSPRPGLYILNRKKVVIR